jgi:hypothetical protein
MRQNGAQSPIPKHARYATAYQRFGFFWGLGIEHETYIATSQTRRVTEFSAVTMKPERYSVSYYKNYQPEPLKTALRALLDASGGTITVPILMNCHSFTDCDVYGEHRNTYEKVPKPNPRYTGQTMWDWIIHESPWLAKEKDRVFMWDGDTVEFMTQRFYCATVDVALAELAEGHSRFIAELNRLPRRGLLAGYGPLRLASPQNEPFATYLTNPRSISMFNNGTIHINVTLPTRLDWNKKPLRFSAFVNRHRRLARLIQWWEPIWIAAYGAGDPLVGGAAGSQRCAVSRYIGIGTFDTAAMPVGKILQVPRNQVGELPWYDWLRARTIYAPLDVVGMDLNFNKHWAHGLELRFFEQMPADDLRSVLVDLVTLMDCSLATRDVPDPRIDPRWQAAAGEGLLYGRSWRVPPEYLGAALAAAGCPSGSQKEPLRLADALAVLRAGTAARRGFCWRHMVNEEPVGCWPL